MSRAAPPAPPPLPGFLSARAAQALKPSLPYFAAFMAAQDDLWSPSNPRGHIAMAVAENRLGSQQVAEGLQRHARGWPAEMLYYNDMRGIPELRAAVARMLGRTSMQGLAVNPDHLVLAAGCGALLDLYHHAIASPMDAVLIPAPYYPAFDSDLRLRAGVVPVPVHLNYQQQDDFGPALDAAAAAAAARGHPVAALLLTHPHNPRGTLYSRQQLASMLAWCLRNKRHCLSDEVYANSVFGADAPAFVSMAHVAAEQAASMQGGEHAGELVAVMGGFSKDFCASGLRVGVLHTANEALRTALATLCYFCSIPAPLQWSLAQLLDDEAWLSSFLADNRARLAAAYATLAAALDAARIPYVPAVAGMFVWVDLSATLPSSSSGNSSSGDDSSSSSSGSTSDGWAEEAAFWEFLVQQQRIVITPGSTCHAAKPGWFRLCWAWPPDSGCLEAAVQRIAAGMAAFRGHRQHLLSDEQADHAA